MDAPLIQISGLYKQFRNVNALQGLNLEVPKGAICGFLGRNGAGKTTTIKVLLGALRPSSGSAKIFGLPVDNEASSVAIRRRIGFVSESKDLFPGFTVAQMIEFVRPFYPRWRSDLERQYLDLFELSPNQKTCKLSKGMRTKLMLLMALCHEAELLILDEPTDGLDPVMVEEVLRVIVARAAEDGSTIFFSSHQLHEVEQIADYVAMIDRGRLVMQGELDDIKTQYRRINVVFDAEPPTPEFALAGATTVMQKGRTVSLLASNGVDELVQRARSLRASSVEVQPVSLKEIFLNLAKGDK
jgi:ABC-2 type transport system ATP-binding protein